MIANIVYANRNQLFRVIAFSFTSQGENGKKSSHFQLLLILSIIFEDYRVTCQKLVYIYIHAHIQNMFINVVELQRQY